MQSRPWGIVAVKSGCLATLLALGGCGGITSGLYGSAGEDAAQQQVEARAETGPIKIPIDPDEECPQINVPAGTSSYAPSGGGDIRYQARISNFARECVLEGGTAARIKIGVEGRFLLGLGGGSGSYSAPLRIAVRDQDTNVVYSKVIRVSGTIPPGETQATFKVVDDGAVVPLAIEKPLKSYDIQVGFGEKGDAAPARHRPRRR